MNANLSFRFQVTFRTSYYHWNLNTTTNSVNQVSVGNKLLITSAVCYGKAKNESFSIPHILFSHSIELRLKYTETSIHHLLSITEADIWAKIWSVKTTLLVFPPWSGNCFKFLCIFVTQVWINYMYLSINKNTMQSYNGAPLAQKIKGRWYNVVLQVNDNQTSKEGRISKPFYCFVTDIY